MLLLLQCGPWLRPAALLSRRLRLSTPVLWHGSRLLATPATRSDLLSPALPKVWKPVVPLSQRLHQLPRLYAQLSKLKLSALVVVTTMAGLHAAPHPPTLSLFLGTVGGVALSSFSAAAFNQWLEAPFDSQMARTRLRPLPIHALTSLHAFLFASLTGVLGVATLAFTAGGLPALLAGANIILYAGAYTPLKRASVANTWIGSVVGAIPPIIGYVAADGGVLSAGSLALGALLYCWQFPHFNSLSWNLRGDYARAGYHMASVLNPALTTAVALRHSCALIPLSALIYGLGVCTDPLWLLDSSLLNLLLIYLAYRFRRHPSRHSARRLFFFSLLHLPLLLILLLLHKQPLYTTSSVNVAEQAGGKVSVALSSDSSPSSSDPSLLSSPPCP